MKMPRITLVNTKKCLRFFSWFSYILFHSFIFMCVQYRLLDFYFIFSEFIGPSVFLDQFTNILKQLHLKLNLNSNTPSFACLRTTFL